MPKDYLVQPCFERSIMFKLTWFLETPLLGRPIFVEMNKKIAKIGKRQINSSTSLNYRSRV